MLATFSIFIALFLLNISIGLEENKGVTIEKVTNSTKANCASSTTADCKPSNWLHCYENEGIGDEKFFSCGGADKNCVTVLAGKKGTVDLCCSDDPIEN